MLFMHRIVLLMITEATKESKVSFPQLVVKLVTYTYAYIYS